MLKHLVRKGVLVALLLSGARADATLSDCKDLYVIRIHVHMPDGKPWAVFATNPNASSGSYWTYPSDGWPERSYQPLYAALLASKLPGKEMSIVTTAPNQCSITQQSHNLTEFELQAGQ